MRTAKRIVEPRHIPISEAMERARARKHVLEYVGQPSSVAPWGTLETGQLVEVWGEQAEELMRTGLFRAR